MGIKHAWKRFKSAVTGRFVTDQEGTESPSTTFKTEVNREYGALGEPSFENEPRVPTLPATFDAPKRRTKKSKIFDE